MELIYLWVEDYKNIQNQGFNFSSDFNCTYDENTKELEINKKKSLDNFFGENINITTIIGENGSGKSTLMKLFFLLIYYKKYLTSDNIHIKLIQQKYKKSLFAIIINDQGKYEKITLNCDISCKQACEEIKDIDFFSLYFSYILDTWYDDYEDDWVNQIYHKKDNYSTPLLLQPNKQDSDTLANTINIDMITYLNSQRLLQFYSNVDINKSITNFFKPHSIKVENSYNTMSYSNNGSDVEFNVISKIGNHLLKTANKYKWILNYSSDSKMLNEIKKLEDDNDFEYINQLYITLKVLLSDESSFDKIIYARVKKSLKQAIADDKLILKENLIQINEFNSLIKENLPKFITLKLMQCFNFQVKDIYKNEIFIKLFNGTSLDLTEMEVKNILPSIPPWIKVDFYDDTKSLSTLSSGEKALLTIILNIMYQFQNISEERYKTINIFLDETELGLHPQWQKRYISDILESIKPLNTNHMKINFIIATHSPFILSDIPKENVLFIENGKQVNVNINPFGANIHTLLSHGFFMKNGLMGDFAKEKIDNAIKYLNQKKLTDDEVQYCENIISIIGEPIIKNQLQRMLDSRRLSDVEVIKKQIEELQISLKSLEAK